MLLSPGYHHLSKMFFQTINNHGNHPWIFMCTMRLCTVSHKSCSWQCRDHMGSIQNPCPLYWQRIFHTCRLYATINGLNQTYIENFYPIFSHNQPLVLKVQFAEHVCQFTHEFHQYQIIYIGLELCSSHICSCYIPPFMTLNERG